MTQRSCLHTALPVALTLLCCAAAARAAPAAPKWHDYMPAEVIGARSFVKAHPTWDGRGVVVAILDTGVDPRASGLTRTSTGAVKVIEARDFSGQGDVALAPATPDASKPGQVRNRHAELGGLQALKERPMDGVWLLGAFAEDHIGRIALRDVNHDGKANGKLAVLIWRVARGDAGLRIAMDLDGDGNIGGEQVVRPYHVAQELMVPKARAPSKDVAMLSFAAEVDPSEHAVVLHFTDGSHGTHVAGIICGHTTFGQAGWQGVAPGAQVLSLKIGHNARSGGATTTEAFKRALQFAGDWSDEKHLPVVLNASYGIGSSIEARSDIDVFVDKLVQRHPLLTISLSAGNAGPGLSSVGTPAAANLALAVGAMVPKDSVATLYGGKVSAHRMFSFSSRGGELTKPEIVAPGVAAAAVPVWDGREIKNGTSMAAPHVAGAMALLWSAVAASKVKGAHSGIVRRALIHSATPLAGYGMLDQGRGLIHVGRAWALLGRLLQNKEARSTLGYMVGSDAPHPSGERMPASFLRSGLFTEDGRFSADIQVQALLPGTATAEERAAWATTYTLKSDAPWLKLDRRELLLRGEVPKHFKVHFDGSRLGKPGIYTARVTGRASGASDDQVAFESWQTVVVPERLEGERRDGLSWPKITLQPGQVWRRLVVLPPGVSHASFRVRPTAKGHAAVRAAVFDPDGHHARLEGRSVSSQLGSEALWQGSGRDLRPGVWELTLAGSIRSDRPSVVDAVLEASAVAVGGKVTLKASSGGLPRSEVTLTNLSGRPFHGTAAGMVDRQLKQGEAKVTGDVHRLKVTLGPNHRGALLKLALSPTDYNRTTDIAVMIRDHKGNTIASTAFNEPRSHIQWPHLGGEATYTVVVEAGMTHRRPDKPWRLRWRQALLLARPVDLTIKPVKGDRLLAWPGVALKLRVQANGPLPAEPDGFTNGGEIVLKWPDGQRRWLSLPVRGAGKGKTK